MTFLATLNRHLAAVRDRDLAALQATLPAEGALSLVFPGGRRLTSVAEFVAFHQDWFKDMDWTVTHEVLQTIESADMGVAVLKAAFTDKDREGRDVAYEVVLSLVFQNQGGAWALVHDQNTMIEKRSAT